MTVVVRVPSPHGHVARKAVREVVADLVVRPRVILVVDDRVEVRVLPGDPSVLDIAGAAPAPKVLRARVLQAVREAIAAHEAKAKARDGN